MSATEAAAQGTLPSVAPLTEGDASLVAHMRSHVLGWDRNIEYVARAIRDGHAVGAFDGGLVAFRYQHRLAPDVLGDGLTLVHPAWRGRGIGRHLVHEFERTAPDHFHLSVVINTDLHASATPKPDSTGFWTACGYQLAATTGPTRLLTRHLR